MKDELVFKVEKQKDGWYLASTEHRYIGGATEAPDYTTLRERVKEAASFLLRDFTEEELIRFELSRNPVIRLKYSEFLISKPEKEKILIAVNPEGVGYRFVSELLGLNLYHEDLDTLRNQILDSVKQSPHQDKHIEFTLEEVLHLEPSSV